MDGPIGIWGGAEPPEPTAEDLAAWEAHMAADLRLRGAADILLAALKRMLRPTPSIADYVAALEAVAQAEGGNDR